MGWRGHDKGCRGRANHETQRDPWAPVRSQGGEPTVGWTYACRPLPTLRLGVVGDGDGGLGAVVCGHGEEFDRPVEPVAGRATDPDAFDGPAGRAHGDPGRYLSGKAAPLGAVLVEVCRAVN